MSDPGQDTHAQAAVGPRRMSLFVVERRLPKVTEQQLAVLLAALSGAAGRFSARGDGVCSVADGLLRSDPVQPGHAAAHSA